MNICNEITNAQDSVEIYIANMKSAFQLAYSKDNLLALDALVNMIIDHKLLWYGTVNEEMFGAVNQNNALRFTKNGFAYKLVKQQLENESEGEEFDEIQSVEQDSASEEEQELEQPAAASIAQKRKRARKCRSPKDGAYKPSNQRQQQTLATSPDSQLPIATLPQPMPATSPHLIPATSILNSDNFQPMTWTKYQDMSPKYTEKIQKRLQQLVNPSVLPVNDNVEKLLKADDTFKISSAINNLISVTDMQRDTLQFYKHLGAYYQYKIHGLVNETPKETRMMIMTRKYGFQERDFMLTNDRGQMVDIILKKFGPAALVAQEYFKVKVLIGKNRFEHVNACQQDTELVAFFESFDTDDLKRLIANVTEHIGHFAWHDSQAQIDNDDQVVA
ncbi:hypothetical protein MAM1_0315d09571 [Mucor ambiguus]|uniref:Uncharacterized protein n=1 Tax=Mucor ambiguus TaxID=91626 RepID=A0A0C9N1Z0_9FUNG|nr:hypothetical protein MAM1_0315d09571 [Mucor ambiguus]